MKTVIVTGSSGNLGQAVVKRFIQEGFMVVGTVIPNDPAHMDYPPDRFETVVVDLMNEDASKQCIDAIVGKYGSQCNRAEYH
jgi:NAD(P)-dependent dehydrogenase (short-subunit alcohol dehydrogenase family)